MLVMPMCNFAPYLGSAAMMNSSKSTRALAIGLFICILSSALPAVSAAAHVKTVNGKNNSPAIDVSAILQRWAYSMEEKATPGVEVYRTYSSWEFPPSRFRPDRTFSSNGTCTFSYPGVDDVPVLRACRWKIEAADHSTLEITTGEATKRYEIIELSKDILRLAPLQSNDK